MPRKRKTPEELIQSRKITNTYLIAMDLYLSANQDITPLINRLKPGTLLRQAMLGIDRWWYTQGGITEDCTIKFWITQKNRSAFTSNSINRLLSLLFKNYHKTVLIKFIIVGEDGWLTEEKDE